MNVDLELARRTWRSVEAYHGMIYFAPEASARYKALGLAGRAGYFVSRSAAMGTASAELVIATFYNFNPDLVRSVIPAAWQVTTPEAILAARIEAADAALRRILGKVVESPGLERAAALARRAAEAVSGDVQGRPLYAAHAALPWPEPPHLVLWHAQTLLREYRGDGHVAALLTAGLSGIEALVTHAASGSGAVTAEALRATRAWPEDAWAAAEERLRERGWLNESGAFTDEGQLARNRIEETTDRLALLPYAALGPDGCRELQELARPLTSPLVDELMPWARGYY